MGISDLVGKTYFFLASFTSYIFDSFIDKVVWTTQADNNWDLAANVLNENIVTWTE